MQIADLRIENFRGISTGHIRFGAHEPADHADWFRDGRGISTGHIRFGAHEPADHADWFRDGRGVIKWWNPVTGAVSATRNGWTGGERRDQHVASRRAAGPQTGGAN